MALTQRGHVLGDVLVTKGETDTQPLVNVVAGTLGVDLAIELGEQGVFDSLCTPVVVGGPCFVDGLLSIAVMGTEAFEVVACQARDLFVFSDHHSDIVEQAGQEQLGNLQSVGDL